MSYVMGRRVPAIPLAIALALGAGCALPVDDGASDDGGAPSSDPDQAAQALDDDCVYVEWCNAPGENGTVCRLRASCGYEAATLNECIAETRSVCGAPTQPWLLY